MRKNFYDDLGGFAEEPSVVSSDGDYDEYCAFNVCLAENYINAIYEENFDDLGEIDPWFLDQILMWYEVNWELDIEEIKNYKTGMNITMNNRPFVEAVIEDGNDCLAETFICNGNHDPRLYALCMTETSIFSHVGLLSSDGRGRDEYLSFLRDVFDCVEEDYKNAAAQDKIKMLSVIKERISDIRYSEDIGPISLGQVGEYQFVKDFRENKEV